MCSVVIVSACSAGGAWCYHSPVPGLGRRYNTTLSLPAVAGQVVMCGVTDSDRVFASATPLEAFQHPASTPALRTLQHPVHSLVDEPHDLRQRKQSLTRVRALVGLRATATRTVNTPPMMAQTLVRKLRNDRRFSSMRTRIGEMS